MLMTCQPLFDAVDALATPDCEVVYLCPDGEQLTNKLAKELAQKSHLILISGHYEGIDQRFRDKKVTREVSIGDYVLTNGTLPACVLVDCLGRQIPRRPRGGKLLDGGIVTTASCSPFRSSPDPLFMMRLEVPPVLLGGNHAEIEKWRRDRQIEKTKQRRPDLMKDQEHQP
jgi:tRNA (guanine37-N1)-methyltransferase